MGKVTKSKKPDSKSSIGDRIRYIRTKKGISQDELGGRISKSRVEINYYENSTRFPDIQTLVDIANALEVSMDYLCGLNDIEKPTIKYQAVNEMIGLNEGSIYMLSKFANAEKIAKDSGMEPYKYAGVEKERLKLDMVNQLLSSSDFEEILNIMLDYKDILKCLESKKMLSDFRKYDEKYLLDQKDLCEVRMFRLINKILCNKD